MNHELIKDIIIRFYHDYIDTHFITEDELDQLCELFGVIYSVLEVDAPSREQLCSVLSELKGEAIRLVHLDLSKPLDPDQSTDIGSYLDILRSREIPGDQRTLEWKRRRLEYITASVSLACAGGQGKVARENQMLEKASYGQFSSFHGSHATVMGNIFEPVTNNHYCYINNTRIHDFGLIPNDKEPYTFLAASTDGVAERGGTLTNIEIKTLTGRVPDGKVKKVYYHQMQHQMECLHLDHSDFLEACYQQYADCSEISKDTTLPVGVIAEIWDEEERDFIYEYSPAGLHVNELEKWTRERDQVIRTYSNRTFIRWTYWMQTRWSCIRVERDPKWIVTMGPLLQQFYDELLALRSDQKEVQRRIRDRELRAHNKRTAGNSLFTDCVL